MHAEERLSFAAKSGERDQNGQFGTNERSNRGAVRAVRAPANKQAGGCSAAAEEGEDVMAGGAVPGAVDQDAMHDAEALDASWGLSAGSSDEGAAERGSGSSAWVNSQELERSDEQDAHGGTRHLRGDGGSLAAVLAGESKASRRSRRARGPVEDALRCVGAAARKWSGRGEFVGWGGLWGLGCGAGGDGGAKSSVRVTRSLELVRPLALELPVSKRWAGGACARRHFWNAMV
jgi:hypothetical protein